MITVTFPKFFAIAMTIWFTLDIIKMLLDATLNITDKREKRINKEIEKALRGIK